MSLNMKLLFFLTISLSLILSPVAKAQDTENAVPIEEGQPAPFTGTLLTNEAAADLLSQIQTCSDRAELDLKFQLERANSVCNLEKSLLEINVNSQKQMYENIILSQDRQLEYILKTRNPKLSKEASFIIGVASGVLLTVASAYTISIATSNL